jgi:hypothetical protein
MFGFIAPLLGAAGASATTQAIVGAAASYMSAKQQRKQAIADQDNQFVRMRNAAQRAGLNPLTVLRATGGQGFTGLPVISKAAAFGNAAAGIFDAVRQAPIDKYNEEIQELNKREKQASIENMIAGTIFTKKQTAAIGKQSFDGPQSVQLMDSNGEPVTGSDGKPLYVPAESYEAIPKYKIVYDQNTKQMYAILNPELTETGPTELVTGVGMDAAASKAAQEGLDLEWGGVGFPRDPLGLNRGVFSRSGSNATLGWPKN